MRLFDGIVFSLQRTRGISVLFSETLSRLPVGSFELMESLESPPASLRGVPYSYLAPRIFERYRRAGVTRAYDLFHSTYYRLPDKGRAKVVTTVHDYVYERCAGVAEAAAAAGVRRMILLSSVAVYGEETTGLLTASTPSRPSTPYGISRKEADEVALEVASGSALEVVLLRMPMVYGEG